MSDRFHLSCVCPVEELDNWRAGTGGRHLESALCGHRDQLRKAGANTGAKGQHWTGPAAVAGRACPRTRCSHISTGHQFGSRSVFFRLDFIDQFTEGLQLSENFVVLKSGFDCLKFTMSISGDIRMVALEHLSVPAVVFGFKVLVAPNITEADLIRKFCHYSKMIIYKDFATIQIEHYFPNFSYSSSIFRIFC